MPLSTLLAGAVVGVHLVSVHVPATDAQHNFNPGAYVRLANGVTLGGYRNTLGRPSFYAAYTVDWGPFSLTAGAITGYQRRVVGRWYGWCGELTTPESGRICEEYAGHSRSRVSFMLAPSVRLPEVVGLTPRISYVPKVGRSGGASAFHLSVERAL